MKPFLDVLGESCIVGGNAVIKSYCPQCHGLHWDIFIQDGSVSPGKKTFSILPKIQLIKTNFLSALRPRLIPTILCHRRALDDVITQGQAYLSNANSPQARDAGGLWKLEEIWTWILPTTSTRNAVLLTPWFQDLWLSLWSFVIAAIEH